MKFKKKILISILVVITLFILGITAFALKNPALFHCVTVSFSNNFEKYDNNLYISKDTPLNIRDSIRSLIKAADSRVSNYWNTNKREGKPVVIFCNNKELFSKYSPGEGTITYKTPINCYIIFGNKGIDIDILSHELFHTEFFERIGYIKSTKEIPVWFDEGLAMQVDYRKDFSEEKYSEITDSIKTIPALSQINSPGNFWNANFYFHYLIARHEVDTWLKRNGKPALFNLVEKINNGESFNSVYHNN